MDSYEAGAPQVIVGFLFFPLVLTSVRAPHSPHVEFVGYCTQAPALKCTSPSHFCTYIFEQALKLNNDMGGNSKGTQTEKTHLLPIIFFSLTIFLVYCLVTQDPPNGHHQGNKKFKAQIPHSEPHA